ncbi:MAG TPA: DUF4224 domain-containing protein [Azoarcus taiwanensis]|nr:DUF4224 domain-containing protein [Azoarcus taiwanensis]
MDDPLFLSDKELHELTGRKIRRLQIDQLRRMLIPFHVNALGRPVVTRAAVIGMQQIKQDAAQKGWSPRVVNG